MQRKQGSIALHSLIALSLMVALLSGATGCANQSSANADADQKNKERYAEWLKANPQDPKGIQNSYNLRQAELAKKRAKAAGKATDTGAAKKPAADKPGASDTAH